MRNVRGRTEAILPEAQFTSCLKNQILIFRHRITLFITRPNHFWPFDFLKKLIIEPGGLQFLLVHKRLLMIF